MSVFDSIKTKYLSSSPPPLPPLLSPQKPQKHFHSSANPSKESTLNQSLILPPPPPPPVQATASVTSAMRVLQAKIRDLNDLLGEKDEEINILKNQYESKIK